jgi:hypothetical protein
LHRQASPKSRTFADSTSMEEASGPSKATGLSFTLSAPSLSRVRPRSGPAPERPAAIAASCKALPWAAPAAIGMTELPAPQMAANKKAVNVARSDRGL